MSNIGCSTPEKENQRMKGFYFITDRSLSRQGILADVQDALDAGVKLVQYREKELPLAAQIYEARAVCSLCVQYNAYFIINDRIDLALACCAHGVHLGQDDFPCSEARKLLGSSRLIGVTVHNLQEALCAQDQSADYLGISPIFATTTKPDAGEACGTERITQIKTACRLPLAAIGGITKTNAAAVVKAGADMLCSLSAVLTGKSAAETIRFFQALYNGEVKDQ